MIPRGYVQYYKPDYGGALIAYPRDENSLGKEISNLSALSGNSSTQSTESSPRHLQRQVLRESSGTSEADSEVEETGRFRGFVALFSVLLCSAFFVAGIGMPFIEVSLFPDSAMETVIVESVVGVIKQSFEGGFYMGAICLTLCTVGIPALLLIGILVIMWDDFFAVGFDRHNLLSPSSHAVMAELMAFIASYQNALLCMVILFKAFFTGGGSSVILRIGFYCLSMCSLLSIAAIQVMEEFRVNAPGMAEEVLPAITGFNLRRRFSSFFPSLPSIKESVNVDILNVLFFLSLLLLLLLLGFNEPLLDIRVVYRGVTLERSILSLKDIIVRIATYSPLPVAFVFGTLVLVTPLLYGLALVCGGFLNHFDSRRQEGYPPSGSEDDSDEDDIHRHLGDRLLTMANLLRPWVMNEVFCIALVLVMYAQFGSDYVVATIPDGIVTCERGFPIAFGTPDGSAAVDPTTQAYRLQPFSGCYLIVGTGVATLFLRWFWSSRACVRKMKHRESWNPCEESDDEELPDESWFAVCVCGKWCRGLALWMWFCFMLHALPPSLSEFKLDSLNTAMNMTVPILNHAMQKYVPASAGNCAAGDAPQPCREMGVLDQHFKDSMRITVEWVSGANTVQIDNATITRTQDKQDWSTTIQKYELDIKGIIGQAGGLLRLENCPTNETGLPDIGKHKCKTFLDTQDACCEPDRHFRVRVSAQCLLGDEELSEVKVVDVDLDEITVSVAANMNPMEGVTATAQLATKDVTGMLIKMMKKEISGIIKDRPIAKLGEQDLTVVNFLNRVLRFNGHHAEFHCR